MSTWQIMTVNSDTWGCAENNDTKQGKVNNTQSMEADSRAEACRGGRLWNLSRADSKPHTLPLLKLIIVIHSLHRLN